MTLHVATEFSRLNPEMAIGYVSGASTNSTEKGKSMVARVKGKTENDLMKLPLRKCMHSAMVTPTNRRTKKHFNDV